MDQKRTLKVTKKSKKTWKVVVWAIVGLLVMVGLAFAAVTVASRAAIDDYRQSAADQLNNLIVAGEPSSDEAVELGVVPAAQLVNPDYKRIDDLQGEYKTLLGDVENYLATLAAHNEFVRQYNETVSGFSATSIDGAKASAALNGLASGADAYAKQFPSGSEQNAKLTGLATQARSSANEVANGTVTAYQTVTNAGSAIIQSYENALGTQRQKLDSDLANFQVKINQ